MVVDDLDACASWASSDCVRPGTARIPLQWSIYKHSDILLVFILLLEVRLVETPNLVYRMMRAWAFFSYSLLLLGMFPSQETAKSDRHQVQTAHGPAS